MRFATVNVAEEEIAAILINDSLLPLETINDRKGTRWPTELLALIEDDSLCELQEWLAGEDLSEVNGSIPTSEAKYGPLYRRPRKIWGIGLNYVEHAGDLSETAPSGEPASFMKPDTTIVGLGEHIRLPAQSERVTAEAELGLVIAREARDVAENEAMDVVAGFTTIVDMTAEDILQENPRYLTRAKSFDTFFSFGPHLVTPDEVSNLPALEVATVLNSQVHRKNTISNMTFSPEFLVSFHSKVMTLLPGDIISTGTPGAAVIRDGDVVGCEISGFEPLHNPVAK